MFTQSVSKFLGFYYSRASRKIFNVLFSILILAGMLVPAAAPAYAASCTEWHTVRRGETLYRIGLQYGVNWKVLMEMNDLRNPNRIYAGQELCVSEGDNDNDEPTPARTPTFRIVGVVTNRTVTIETANFPANDTFVARMDRYGTAGARGIRAGSVNTGKGGKFTATFEIPEELTNLRRIAIRLESPTSGFFSYNWFYNATTGSGTGGPYEEDDNDGYTGIPTFTIVEVLADQTVTVRARNFPANVKFDVLMGHIGTRAVNGLEVTTFDSGKGGSFTMTFNIPSGLKGDRRIAIRMEAQRGGYYSYNWFYNTTTR